MPSGPERVGLVAGVEGQLSAASWVSRIRAVGRRLASGHVHHGAQLVRVAAPTPDLLHAAERDRRLGHERRGGDAGRSVTGRRRRAGPRIVGSGRRDAHVDGNCSSSRLSADIRALAAPVDIMVTRVTPMSSAMDVADVRRGLRSVLATARRAAGPVRGHEPAQERRDAREPEHRAQHERRRTRGRRRRPRRPGRTAGRRRPRARRRRRAPRSRRRCTGARSRGGTGRARACSVGASDGRSAASGATRVAARAGASAAGPSRPRRRRAAASRPAR